MMVEVKLSRILIDEKRGEQVIVLKEATGDRLLPIVIGINEAVAIKMNLNKIKPPRPLTHDLICSVMDTFGLRLEKVVIDKLVENTFHAKLYFTTLTHQAEIIDARPSDSIALAVRKKTPIFVNEQIWEKLSPGI